MLDAGVADAKSSAARPARRACAARLDASRASCKLPPVSPSPERPWEDPAYVRKVVLARRVVLSIAAVVGLTLVGALVLGLYHHTTDRPGKALFGLQD